MGMHPCLCIACIVLCLYSSVDFHPEGQPQLCCCVWHGINWSRHILGTTLYRGGHLLTNVTAQVPGDPALVCDHVIPAGGRTVWWGVQRRTADSLWLCECGSEVGEEWSSSRGEGDAATGGSHHGTVQTQTHCLSGGNGHCWWTSKLQLCNNNMNS